MRTLDFRDDVPITYKGTSARYTATSVTCTTCRHILSEFGLKYFNTNSFCYLGQHAQFYNPRTILINFTAKYYKAGGGKDIWLGLILFFWLLRVTKKATGKGNWIDLHWTELDWIRMAQNGLYWIGSDWMDRMGRIGSAWMCWIRTDWIASEWIK